MSAETSGRAAAPDMRKSMEMAELFKKAGIRFVPMPVRDDAVFTLAYNELLHLFRR